MKPLSLSRSLSHVGREEVAGHSSRVVVVGRSPAWSPTRSNEGGRLHGGRARLLDGRRPSSSCSKTACIPRILSRCSRKPSKSDAGLTGGPTAPCSVISSSSHCGSPSTVAGRRRPAPRHGTSSTACSSRRPKSGSCSQGVPRHFFYFQKLIYSVGW
jgi:hypothetical protein